MDKIIIRKAEEKDLESIRELHLQWEEENITYGFGAGDPKYLMKKILSTIFFVAQKDKKIIGFVSGRIHIAKDITMFYNEEEYIEIDNIYVNKDFRSMGIGGKLMNTILDKAKQAGVERSTVYSSTKDYERTIRFYNKHGYKTWSVEMFK